MRKFKLHYCTINANSIRAQAEKPIMAANKIAKKIFSNTNTIYIYFAIQDISNKKTYKYSASHTNNFIKVFAYNRRMQGGSPPSLQELAFKTINKNPSMYKFNESSKQAFTYLKSSLKNTQNVIDILDKIIYNNDVLEFYKNTSYLQPYRTHILENTFDNVETIISTIRSFIDSLDKNRIITSLKLDENDDIEIKHNDNIIEHDNFTTYLDFSITSPTEEYIKYNINVSHVKQGLYTVFLQYNYNLHNLSVFESFNSWLRKIFEYKILFRPQVINGIPYYHDDNIFQMPRGFDKLSLERVVENIYINYYYYLPLIKSSNKEYSGELRIDRIYNEVTYITIVTIKYDNQKTLYNIYVEVNRRGKIIQISFFNNEKNKKTFEKEQEEKRLKEAEEASKRRKEALEKSMEYDPDGPPSPYS